MTDPQLAIYAACVGVGTVSGAASMYVAYATRAATGAT